jgi:predicted dehydrogenase
MDKVKLAMVGCGGIAGAHRRGMEALWNAGYRKFEVVAACDVVPEKAEAMATEVAKFQGTRPEVFDNLADLLKKGPACHAVDICTLHSEHHTTAVPCLRAGKHVIIEKPLGITLRAGKRMLEAARKARRILHTAENYRLTPQHRAIKWAVKSGMVGKVRMIYWLQVRERLWYWTWREHKMQAGAGWALDGGVHYCDLFRYFVGPVSAVSASVENFFPYRFKDAEKRKGRIKVDVEDTMFAVLEFECGALGLWVSTTAAPGDGFNKNAIYGDKGSITWDTGLNSQCGKMTMEELQDKFMKSLSEKEKQKLFPHGVTDSIGIELHQFFEAVQGRGKVETDGMEGFKAEAIALATFESHELGRKVTMKEVESLKVEKYQSEINKALHIK